MGVGLWLFVGARWRGRVKTRVYWMGELLVSEVFAGIYSSVGVSRYDFEEREIFVLTVRSAETFFPRSKQRVGWR